MLKKISHVDYYAWRKKENPSFKKLCKNLENNLFSSSMLYNISIISICQNRTYFIFASCLFFVDYWPICSTLSRWSPTWNGVYLALVRVYYLYWSFNWWIYEECNRTTSSILWFFDKFVTVSFDCFLLIFFTQVLSSSGL